MATMTHKSGSAAAAELLRSLSEIASGKRFRAFMAAAPGIVEVMAVAAIGVFAAQTIFALFAPLPTPQTLPASLAPQNTQSEIVSLERTPFRVAAVEATAPALEAAAAYEETQLDLTLHGVFVLDGIPRGIISTPDGKQGSFGLGETVWNDVTLERIVSSEQVVILVSGARETLTLKNRDPKTAGAKTRSEEDRLSGPRPAPQAVSGGLPIGDIANISLLPSAGGPRLVLQPGVNRAAFDAAGLKAGDVLVAVNNRRIGADLASEARRFAVLAQSGKISLLVERDGTSVPIEITTPGNGR